MIMNDVNDHSLCLGACAADKAIQVQETKQ